MKKLIFVAVIGLVFISCVSTRQVSLTEGQKLEKYNLLREEGYKSFFTENNWSKALDQFSEAYALNSDDTTMYGMMGVCYVNLGKLEKGKQIILDFLKIDSLHNADMYHYIGYTYGFTFRQVKEGIQFITTAMSFRNGEKNQWDYLRRAQLYILIKDFDAAKNDLSESIEIAGNHNDQLVIKEATGELNKIK